MNLPIEVKEPIGNKQRAAKIVIQERIPAVEGDFAAGQKTVYDFLRLERAY